MSRRSSHAGIGSLGGQPGGRFNRPPEPPSAATSARNAAGVVVVTQFQSGHGWVTAGGTTSLNDTTASPSVGTQCAWLQGDATNAIKAIKRVAGTAYDLTNYDIGVQIRVDNPDAISTGASLAVYAGNGNFTNYISFAMQHSSSIKAFPKRNTYASNFGGAWQHYTITTDPAASGLPTYIFKSGAQTTAQILANVTDWQFYWRDVSAGPVTRISIQEVYLVPKQSTYANGVCCLTFDDGFTSNLTIAAPMLQAVSGRASTYVIKEALAQSASYISTAQLRTLQDTYGWQVSCHAYANAAHTSPGYTGLTAAAGIADLQAERQWLQANGFTGYNHIAYPNGNYCLAEAETSSVDDAVDTALAPYLKTARTIVTRSPETVPPGSRMHLKPTVSVTSGTTLATLTAAADMCKRQKSALIIVMHEIVASGASGVQWLTADLQSLITYIDGIGMPFRTIGEVFG